MYYDANEKCLFCHSKFKTKRILSSKLKVLKRDSDFCLHYGEDNPILYEISICPNCGYAYNKGFKKLGEPYRTLVENEYISKMNPVDLCGMRTFKEGMRALKLGYLAASISREKQVVLGSIALKIAWLHRMDQNEEEEKHCLGQALKHYSDALSAEGYYLNGIDEDKVLFLVADLNARLGNYSAARKGFSSLITNRKISAKYKKYALDRWEEYRDEVQKEKEQLDLQEEL